MSKERINYELGRTVFQLNNEGYSQSDIARHCGVSRQRVSAILLRGEEVYSSTEPDEPPVFQKTQQRVIYPAIRKFLEENRMSLRKFILLVDGYYHCTGTTARFLTGITESISIKRINKILEVTGLKYEEIFMEVIGDEEQRRDSEEN